MSTLRGELVSDKPVAGNDYVAELVSSDSHQVVASSSITNSGNFEFYNVSSGHYTLRVNTLYGQTVTSSAIDASPTSGPIQLRLPEDRREQPVSGTVSVRQLRHPVSKKALDAMAAAQKRSAAGDFAGAIEKLKKAIEIDPEYSDAHNNLGAQYVRAGQYEAGLAEFELAKQVGTESAPLDSNLATALFAVRRFAEAETMARHALALDRGNMRAEFVLGRILMLRAATREEALTHLKRSASEIPSAQVAIALLENQRK